LAIGRKRAGSLAAGAVDFAVGYDLLAYRRSIIALRTAFRPVIPNAAFPLTAAPRDVSNAKLETVDNPPVRFLTDTLLENHKRRTHTSPRAGCILPRSAPQGCSR
jgi:hypothetical protein